MFESAEIMNVAKHDQFHILCDDNHTSVCFVVCVTKSSLHLQTINICKRWYWIAISIGTVRITKKRNVINKLFSLYKHLIEHHVTFFQKQCKTKINKITVRLIYLTLSIKYSQLNWNRSSDLGRKCFWCILWCNTLMWNLYR